MRVFCRLRSYKRKIVFMVSLSDSHFREEVEKSIYKGCKTILDYAYKYYEKNGFRQFLSESVL
jgi:hypothetical protein